MFGIAQMVRILGRILSYIADGLSWFWNLEIKALRIRVQSLFETGPLMGLCVKLHADDSYRPLNTIVLIIGTPKMLPLNFGKPTYGDFQQMACKVGVWAAPHDCPSCLGFRV